MLVFGSKNEVKKGDEIGFYDCPVCRTICLSEDERHRHLEEKHDNLNVPDQELMEKTSGKEVLNE